MKMVDKVLGEGLEDVAPGLFASGAAKQKSASPGRRQGDSQLASLDLTQLRVLDTLLELRSVRLAAERLCLTPSAVSHALGRLRDVIGDELFVRCGNEMLPTPRGLRAAAKVRASLGLLHSAFLEPAFEPGSADAQFTIACLPIVSGVLIHHVVARIRRQAPGVRITVKWLDGSLMSDLQAHRVDLAIGVFGRLPDTLEKQLLFEDHFVLAMRAGHPAAKPRLTERDLTELTHIDVWLEHGADQGLNIYQASGGLERKVGTIDRDLWRQSFAGYGSDRNIAVTAPDTHTALLMIANSDLVGLVSAAAVRELGFSARLHLCAPPGPPPPLLFHMVWHLRDRGDAAHLWLRQTVRDSLQDLGGDTCKKDPET